MLLHLVSEKTQTMGWGEAAVLQCVVGNGLCTTCRGDSIQISKGDALHETAVIYYSKAKSTLTHRKEGEKQPLKTQLTLCQLHLQHFGVSGHKKQHKAASKNLLFGKTGDKMASNGALKVNKHLQVEGYENIYAIGDCADLKEPKMAYHAGLHANVVVTNIINSLTQKPLKTYEPGKVRKVSCMEQLSQLS